ncbi:DNA polymerase II [Methanocella sp. CWC-04]|uniref:DNA polymerase II small subunit n=1 Tax=Methanooceanicella nereidis TaxID=2052831 RepID=A0AAP2REH9_9EURY|nr:DNA-directed DNA polymerase II small subunit [Methanocella sp. CWC-04]MCD1295311.1 DNA polymerase II [Methanocella sp. CWC-04]
MHDMDIVKVLANKGYILEPDALDMLKGSRDPDELIGRLLSGLDPSAFIISGKDVARIAIKPAATGIAGTPPDIRILKDITNNSTCIGDYDEFVGYFRNRFSILGDMMRNRISSRPIESILKKKGMRSASSSEKNEISIIGIVSDHRVTANGHRLIEVEDQTGSISVLIMKDSDICDMPVLLDEVIGVTGVPASDGGLFIASSIIYPDVPYTNVARHSDEPAVAALISDVHVGSDTFLEDNWLSFLDWINGDSVSDQDADLVSRLKYIVVAGDLVDGIGIYPGQDKELHILDIYDQYKKTAEYFDQIPKHISVVISPGNHDAVRQAEPQPALPEEIRSMFRNDNITFVGNPAAVEIEGVRFLIYHGRSIDDMVSNLPGASYSYPEKVMVELLKRRHLSPIYGGRVMIAPESKDHFVIDPLPDVIHSGHVHTVGICRYRGVLLANSGTWQGQTEFQKRMNIQPDPARIPLVDLKSGEVSVIKFGE